MASPLSESPGSGNVTEQVTCATSRFSRNSSLVSREVAGETIVVPICRGVGDLDSVYTFNSVGTALWRLLESGHSTEELARWLTAQYEINECQALSDVQSYLAELQEAGLIRAV